VQVATAVNWAQRDWGGSCENVPLTNVCCTPNCGDTSQRCSTDTWDDGCGNNTCRGTKDCSIGLTLSATPNPINYNTASTLTWTPTNATSCWATGDWTGWKTATGGTESTGNLTAAKTYKLECWNSVNISSGIKSVTVNVNIPPAPALTFTGTYGSQVNQTTLNLQSGPGNVTLNWTTNASTTFCDARDGDATWNAYNPASAGGSSVRAVPATLTYSMECWNAANVSTGVKTVQVNVCNLNCNDSDSHCQGTPYTGNCGQPCTAPLPNSCGGWGTCSKECGGGIQTKDCVCPTRTESRACASRPCPPSYREVSPW